MQYNSKKAFTLIELMIVIVIITLMMTLGYAPYNYYGQKAKVRIAGREIAQSIYEAKNLAISGRSFGGVGSKQNKSIGIVFEKDSNEIKYYEFDYDENFNVNDAVTLDISKNFKNKPLQDKIIIKDMLIGSVNSNEILLYFEAISGKIFVKNLASPDVNDSKKNIQINYGVEKATSQGLNNKIEYFPVTNTTNYKSN